MSLTAEQSVCVNTLDRPVVVAAGAGSGKTYTLTERIGHAFEDGFVSDIDEVCAITFTNKAAAELKSRIKAKLGAIGFGDQVLKADEAWVSTIHGMCSRILKAHALELGVDPSFAVVSTLQQRDLLSQAVDKVLAEARESAMAPQLGALFREFGARAHGRGGNSIESMLGMLVEEASTHVQGSDAFVLPGNSVQPAVGVMAALDIVEPFLEEAGAMKPGAKRDEWIATAEPIVRAARDALDEGVDDYLRALELVGPMTLAAGFGNSDYKARVKEARNDLVGVVMDLRLGAVRPHLEQLVELADRSLAEYAAMKQAQGVVDNNDLLVMAAEAIERHPSIASRYTDKFKLVMIDEFQDTDQMQVDMIKRISGVDASRLCTVGDAQQSIYRFRGADVSVYRRHLESVRSSENGAVVELSKNFRSHKDILAFVDRVFEKDDMFGGEFMSLKAVEKEDVAPFDGAEPRIVVQHTRYSDGSGGVGKAREEAARRIARQFATYHREGRSARDMAILLGVMSNAGVYAQALREEGLPCVLSGGSVFAGALEVQAVRALVGALANPDETQHVLDTLTGPIFSLTAGDLLSAGGLEGFVRASAMVERGDGFDESGCSERLACALKVMGDAWRDVGEVHLSKLVARVVASSGWLSRMQEEKAEGLACAGNVFKAIRKIEEVEQERAYGPVSVKRQFFDLIDSTGDTPGALSVSDSDSVRIMTVHASKGLEFPIVAVAEMREPSVASGLVSASVAGKVHVALYGGATAKGMANPNARARRDASVHLFDLPDDEDELAKAVVEDAGALHRFCAIERHSLIGESEEAKRLLYVALTRAEEALVVSMMGRVTSRSNAAGVPSNVFRGVYTALDRGGAGLGEGVTLCEYGGTMPARFECVEVKPADEVGGAGTSETMPEKGDVPYIVPVVNAGKHNVPSDVYRPLHEGVFSYSSIAESAHGDGVLEMLAEAHVVAADDAARGTAFDIGEQRDFAAFACDSEDDSRVSDDISVFDADRAADLGTAFHRLAQFSVLSRSGDSALAMPPADRVEALARTCNLDAVQRSRLDAALRRWFGSSEAHRMAALPNLAAEVPFFVSVGDEFLEGEIDLLGFDEEHVRAFVVDYKTGGSSSESRGDLERKHVLQAACYAYAILLQGTASVDAAFVRVERPRADADTEPQCVRYRFDADDIPVLEQAIAACAAKRL